MNTKLINYLILLLFVSASLYAQADKYKDEPGYVDFGDMSSFDVGDKVVEVSIDKKYLRMVSKFTGDSDPELSTLIDGLDLIKVNTFGITDENKSAINTKIISIGRRLENSNWDMLVKVKDKGERVNVFVHSPDGENINGLVVLAFDENDEAVFVNIVGKINLEQIGKLSRKFNIPALDGINGNKSDGGDGEK